MIGQPETYADVLKRVFYTTLSTGFLCSLALAKASPELRHLLERVPMTSDFGPIKEIKVLYVALPAAVALASRIVKLHDRISDLLQLRRRIDLDWILYPLLDGTASTPADDTRRLSVRLRRTEAMYRVFYPYVSLPDSAIDRQLVRTALDNYGWFWAALEAITLVLPTATGLWFLGASGLAMLAYCSGLLMTMFAYYQWSVCRRGTDAEISAILVDSTRRQQIASYFDTI
jgi:hypothetical protein